MNAKRTILAVGMAALMFNFARAQVVTVGAAGDFQTLQAAIDSFRTDVPTTYPLIATDPSENIIELLDDYTTEPTRLYIPRSLTSINTTWGLEIRSVAPSGRTIIYDQLGNPPNVVGGDSTYPVWAVYNTRNIKIQNVTLIPGVTTTHGMLYTEAPDAGSSVTTYLDNVWLLPSSGGMPATDGTTPPSGTLITAGNAIYQYSGAVGTTPTLVLTNVRASGSTGNGLTFYNARVEIGEGCYFTYNSGAGIYLNGTQTNYGASIIGTALNPIFVAGNGGAGFTVGTSGSASGFSRIEYVRCIGNAGNGYDQPVGSLGDGVFHSIFALNGGSGGNFYFHSSADPTTNTMDSCTLFNSQYPSTPLSFTLANSGMLAGWDISNTIFAGPADVLKNVTNVKVYLSNCALVLTGPYALGGGANDANHNGINDTDEAKFVLDASVISADPFFVTVDPTSSSFLNVQSAAYETAGTSGQHLAGGALWVGPPSNVGDWRLFN